MNIIPKFSFCDVLCAYVCHDGRCGIVVNLDNLKQHLQRKHSVSASVAKIESAKLLKAVEGKKPQEIANRYLKDPYPRHGESALPALAMLPVYDVLKCPFCTLYFKGVSSCKAHMRSKHKNHEGYERMLDSMRNLPLMKGQALYLGSERLYFPVTSPTNFTSILFSNEPQGQNAAKSDSISLREKSANLTCSILGIPEFLDAQNLSLQSAYSLSKIEKPVHSKLVTLLVKYIQHFAEMQPPVPMSIIEGIKIRNCHKIASFNLHIEMRSKKRYASIAARFITVVSKLRSHPLPQFPIDRELLSLAEQTLLRIGNGQSLSLQPLHSFLSILLLQAVRASEGHMVAVEGLFKLVMGGYTCGLNTGRVRIGDSEDASHTAAALQYFCHIAALGEFFVSPLGFGQQDLDDENCRIKRIKDMLSTEACTPSAYLRTVLLKTKRLSPGESPLVDFVPCTDHPFCGTVENIEVQLNSNNPGSLGYTVRSIRKDAKHLLHTTLMRDYEIPTHFARTALSFPDKHNERESGYYFGSGAEAKQFFRSCADHFARHLSQGDRPIIEYRTGNDTHEWIPTQYASDWLRVADKLSPLLYILVHLCGGGPPRVTEMVDAKFRNVAGSRRNLLIIKKQLALVGSYWKNAKQVEKPKPIARFLDAQTSEIILLFVVYIKPMQCFILQQSMLEIQATEDYLFCQGGEKASDEFICRVFAKELSSRGLPLTVRLYRHFRTGVAKVHIAPITTQSSEQLLFLQAGHTESTARVRYAGGDFNLQDFSLAKLEGFYAISKQWHELLGILDANEPGLNQSNNTGRIKKGEPPRPQANATKAASSEGTVIPKLTDHLTCTVNPVVKRDGSKVCNERPAKRRKATIGRGGGTFSTTGNSASIAESIICSVKQVLSIEQKENVTFKSNAQRSAVFECAMQTLLGGYQNSMMIVLPTGGGKTLCWAAPAWREQCLADNETTRPPITVLIVPLIALQHDMVRKCETYGLRCGLWEDRFTPDVTVVICSVDVVFTNEYERFISALSVQKRVARVIIDEVHLLLQWKQLRRFGLIGERLRPKQAETLPLVFMTATLPDAMTSKLQDLLRLDKGCFKMFRAINRRPNICYNVQRVDYIRADDMIQRCASIIDMEMARMKPQERVIAYCLSVKDCVLLHKELAKKGRKVCIYYGSMTVEEKRGNFGDWIRDGSDEPIAMTSTSAFSCGIDFGHVRIVFHVGGARSLVELAQESGRAGRDGDPSKNVVIYSEKYLDARTGKADHEEFDSEQHNLFGDIKEFLNAEGHCRRQVLESFMNSAPRGPCNGSELKCDVCANSEGHGSTIPTEQLEIGVNNDEEVEMTVVPNRTRVPAPSPLSQNSRSLMTSGILTVAGNPASNSSPQAIEMSQAVPFVPRVPISNPSSHQTQRDVRNQGLTNARNGMRVFGSAMTSRHAAVNVYHVADQGFDREKVIWVAKQLSATNCAVCLFNGIRLQNGQRHADCMRARCFRCVESNAIHQSKNCNVTPRSSRSTLRCFFCGIPDEKDLHEPGTFNKRERCQWIVAKDLALLCWWDKTHRAELVRRFPRFRSIQEIKEVGRALCGGEAREDVPLLANLAEYLYSTFVLRTA